jgi:hypothetical protein
MGRRQCKRRRLTGPTDLQRLADVMLNGFFEARRGTAPLAVASILFVVGSASSCIKSLPTIAGGTDGQAPDGPELAVDAAVDEATDAGSRTDGGDGGGGINGVVSDDAAADVGVISHDASPAADMLPADQSAGHSGLVAGCGLIMDMEQPGWSGMTGEVRDSCLHSNGTAVGDLLPTTMANGHFGRSAYFPAGGCVVIPDDPSLRPVKELTLAAWVNPDLDADNAPVAVFAKRVDDRVGVQYTLFLHTNDAVFVDIGKIRLHGSVKVKYGEWHHVAAVFNGALSPGPSLKIYVDGQLDIGVDAGTAIPTVDPPPPLHLGCLNLDTQTDPFTETFRGEIDEAAIWQRALSDREIGALVHLPEPL